MLTKNGTEVYGYAVIFRNSSGTVVTTKAAAGGTSGNPFGTCTSANAIVSFSDADFAILTGNANGFKMEIHLVASTPNYANLEAQNALLTVQH